MNKQELKVQMEALQNRFEQSQRENEALHNLVDILRESCRKKQADKKLTIDEQWFIDNDPRGSIKAAPTEEQIKAFCPETLRSAQQWHRLTSLLHYRNPVHPDIVATDAMLGYAISSALATVVKSGGVS